MKLNVFYNAYGKRLFMGILAEENRRIFFQYAPEFSAEGIDVSPFKLPLKSGVFEGDYALFDGLFGLFNDIACRTDGAVYCLIENYSKMACLMIQLSRLTDFRSLAQILLVHWNMSLPKVNILKISPLI